MSRISVRCSSRRVLKTTVLSMRFMNSGVNFLRVQASCAVRFIFSSKLSSSVTFAVVETQARRLRAGSSSRLRRGSTSG